MLSDWRNPIRKLQSTLNKVANAKTLKDQNMSTYTTQKPTTNEHSFFLNTIDNLFQLANTVSNANMDKIVGNVQCMAFALGWFGLVRFSLVYTCNSLSHLFILLRVKLTFLRLDRK